MCQVSQIHQINWPFHVGCLFPDIRRNFFLEPPDVISARVVAQVNVRKKQDVIALLILADQFEVMSLHLVRSFGKCRPESGTESIFRHCYAAGRCRDKYHAVGFIADHEVLTVLVGLHDLRPVADQHPGHRPPVERHPSFQGRVRYGSTTYSCKQQGCYCQCPFHV